MLVRPRTARPLTRADGLRVAREDRGRPGPIIGASADQPAKVAQKNGHRQVGPAASGFPVGPADPAGGGGNWRRRGRRLGRSVLPWECGSGARRPHARKKSKTPPSTKNVVCFASGRNPSARRREADGVPKSAEASKNLPDGFRKALSGHRKMHKKRMKSDFFRPRRSIEMSKTEASHDENVSLASPGRRSILQRALQNAAAVSFCNAPSAGSRGQRLAGGLVFRGGWSSVQAVVASICMIAGLRRLPAQPAAVSVWHDAGASCILARERPFR